MPGSAITVRIMRHVINPGAKYGRLTVIAEVQKLGADGRRYRAARCRCDCGNQITPRLSSLICGDARACGYQLARAARQTPNPSYAGWHHRVTRARGAASGYPCADCGRPAQDWT